MNQPNNGVAKRSKWGYAFALLALAACGGVVGKPSVGGESHFLRHCGDGCGSGLECVSDICTRGCRVEGGNCSDLAANAKCTNASLEPGELAVCDVACEASADCRALGADFTCDSGFCRGPALSEPGAGGAGSGSGSGSAGGTGSVAGGATAGGGVGVAGSSTTGGTGHPQDICELPFVSGPCEAAIEVFAYEDGVCVPKIYGGCGGNENRFDTLDKCQTMCRGVPAPVPAMRCQLPFVAGPCDASIEVFAFVDGACARAIYGGCQGNDNRFNTLEECLNVCEGRPRAEPCPEGRAVQEICLECGGGGGCTRSDSLCAQPCDAREPRCDRGLVCDSGFCQVGQCI